MSMSRYQAASQGDILAVVETVRRQPLRHLPSQAVSASQGLHCRTPDGLLDLLLMHVKLPNLGL